MDADLVSSAGLKRDAEQRAPRQQTLDLEMGARLARLVAVDRHQLSVAPVAPDRRVDHPGARRGVTIDERQVLAPKPPSRQQRLQGAVDLVVLGYDQQPRRVSIQP